MTEKPYTVTALSKEETDFLTLIRTLTPAQRERLALELAERYHREWASCRLTLNLVLDRGINGGAA